MGAVPSKKQNISESASDIQAARTLMEIFKISVLIAGLTFVLSVFAFFSPFYIYFHGSYGEIRVSFSTNVPDEFQSDEGSFVPYAATIGYVVQNLGLFILTSYLLFSGLKLVSRERFFGVILIWFGGFVFLFFYVFKLGLTNPFFIQSPENPNIEGMLSVTDHYATGSAILSTLHLCIVLITFGVALTEKFTSRTPYFTVAIAAIWAMLGGVEWMAQSIMGFVRTLDQLRTLGPLFLIGFFLPILLISSAIWATARGISAIFRNSTYPTHLISRSPGILTTARLMLRSFFGPISSVSSQVRYLFWCLLIFGLISVGYWFLLNSAEKMFAMAVLATKHSLFWINSNIGLISVILYGIVGFALGRLGFVLLEFAENSVIGHKISSNQIPSDKFVLYLRPFNDPRGTIRSQLKAKFFRLPTAEIASNTIQNKIAELYFPSHEVFVVENPQREDATSLLKSINIEVERDWRDTVLDLIERSDQIVVNLGESEGLRWEVNTIIERRSFLRKSVFFFPESSHCQNWSSEFKRFINKTFSLSTNGLFTNSSIFPIAIYSEIGGRFKLLVADRISPSSYAAALANFRGHMEWRFS